MKLQCSCGAKYAFDITPEMANNPVKFVCPACGLDSSAFVNSLVRQELGLPAEPAPAPMGVPLDPPPAPAPQPAASARPAVAVRLHTHQAAPVAAEADSADAAPLCPKHPGHQAVEKCRVCSKPICPKCMELFGYVCSPLCKARAESHGIDIPVFAGQKSVAEARMWRKIGWVAGTAAFLVFGSLGYWFYYSFFGCAPKPVFSVRFPTPAYSGQSAVSGKEHEQLVFLHGGTLARHDMKLKQQLWSCDLIDHKAIEEEVVKDIKAMQESNARAADNGMSHPPRIPSSDELKEELELAAASAMQLYVRGENIWVATPGKLVRYDWATGAPAKELPVKDGHGQFVARGDELVLMDTYSDRPTVVHIHLVTGELRTDEITGLATFAAAANTPGVTSSNLLKAGSLAAKATNATVKTGAVAARGARASQMAGLPIGTPGQDAGKPMDPAKVAEQAQNLRYAAKLALPALIAGNMNQERTLAELNDQSGDKSANGADGEDFDTRSRFSLIPTKDGFVQFAVQLLETRFEEHTAMKAAPSKSALEGNVTAGRSLEVANDLLNEMQRSRGGDKVREDVSRYQVTIRRPDSQDVWSGEVVGPPQLHPLKTVNVLTANKLVMVFDKTNKKLWQSALNYNVHGGWDGGDEDTDTGGQGPCVEHKGTLYVFDEGVLTSFDLATGNARWRLPSVGVTGLFFDAKDMIYVNTTTASHESIKFSRQIDITQSTGAVILKVDPKTGTVLWSNDTAGVISRVDDKFVYTVQYHRPSPQDDPEDSSPLIRNQPYVRIRCLNPKNGHERWLHYQERGPLDIQFDRNTIRVVFKKEVQVLKFPTF